MRSLHMEYHYQAKERAVATCIPSAQEIQEQVKEALLTQDKVDYTSTVIVKDVSGNQFCHRNGHMASEGMEQGPHQALRHGWDVRPPLVRLSVRLLA
ncbi:MAG: hypothetical protein R2818_01900 [Flavobacteriales bacterium]